ncbi:MAG: DUF4956 domain-containing protein [Bryobacterales bacterium]|nr:DUF4956 domain-containing protein [Bryobacterales bacterium]
MDLLNQMSSSTATADPRLAVAAMLMAFVCSHALALVYVWSHRGLSYSQSFVQALVMASVAAALMMLVIGNNVVWGIGVMGALALVRFRTNLRDSRDMMFVFVSLVVGLACGTSAFTLAIAGTAAFSLVALYLGRMAFGFRNYFDALVRFTLPSGDAATPAGAAECLRKHCSRVALTMVQQVAQGDATEHVYQVRFRREDSRQGLVRDLEQLHGLSNLSLLLEDTRVDL